MPHTTIRKLYFLAVTELQCKYADGIRVLALQKQILIFYGWVMDVKYATFAPYLHIKMCGSMFLSKLIVYLRVINASCQMPCRHCGSTGSVTGPWLTYLSRTFQLSLYDASLARISTRRRTGTGISSDTKFTLVYDTCVFGIISWIAAFYYSVPQRRLHRLF